MKVHVLIAAVMLAALAVSPAAQQAADTREAHCAAARAAAGTEYLALFNRFADICGAAATAAQPQRGGGAATGPRQVPARDTWYHPPAKVFDNLYFLGTKIHNAWAIQTSEGLIVIDALFDYAVKDSVVEGLRQLKLNPATMKYLIISHGHGDHHGGAKFLQDEFGPRVVMGAADWDLVAKNPRDPIPRRDIAGVDGQKITLGDTTVTLYPRRAHRGHAVADHSRQRQWAPASHRDVGRYGSEPRLVSRSTEGSTSTPRPATVSFSRSLASKASFPTTRITTARPRRSGRWPRGSPARDIRSSPAPNR